MTAFSLHAVQCKHLPITIVLVEILEIRLLFGGKNVIEMQLQMIVTKPVGAVALRGLDGGVDGVLGGGSALSVEPS